MKYINNLDLEMPLEARIKNIYIVAASLEKSNRIDDTIVCLSNISECLKVRILRNHCGRNPTLLGEKGYISHHPKI